MAYPDPLRDEQLWHCGQMRSGWRSFLQKAQIADERVTIPSAGMFAMSLVAFWTNSWNVQRIAAGPWPIATTIRRPAHSLRPEFTPYALHEESAPIHSLSQRHHGNRAVLVLFDPLALNDGCTPPRRSGLPDPIQLIVFTMVEQHPSLLVSEDRW